ncbi:DNA replication regulator SLD3 [Ceratocystis lukuohia]|uniref:DNA replication regulator SLD3 n=1 Tax=Ceratocystis lukuohia TaxID=2019550 RepID=A0ABR4MNC0_9PEZI
MQANSQQPQSSSSNPASHTLYPVLVLPRKHVPLSMLDFHSPFADIYAARRFSAPTIRIVDLETRRSGSPHVLVAVSQNHKLFVLDACDQGIFAICQIGYWVKLNDLTEKASICNWSIAEKLRIRQEDKEKTREKTKKEARESKRTSLSRASSEANARPISNDKAKPAVSSLNSEVGLPKLATTNLSSATQTSIPIVSQSTAPVIPLTPGSNAAPLADAPPTSENIFDNTRTQYWEALYKSVGPLTYFAKGPLSRARAAFTLGTQDNSKMADLVAFLQDLIMTTAQLDIKYRDRIPQIIRDMKGFYNESDDNQADSRPKKRRQRKMKLGKDGLYPYEETKIRDWWRHNMPQLKDGAIITESDIKSYVSLLRVRETQLQLIIILEALALEPLAQVEEADKACESVPISVLPDQVVASIETDRPAKTPVKKPKKRDLATLADILADRLGIWQSTISDELRMIQNSHVPKSSGEDTSKQMEMSSEPLKDFCIDVIIPLPNAFASFAKRLPVVCESISEKLGGPSILPKKKPPKNAEDAPAHNSPAVSIKKEKQMPGAVTKRTAQPRSSQSKRISLGQAMERAVAREERQSLHRSLSRGPSQIIEAMMATQPREVPGLKREFSESNLSRIKSDGSGLMKAPGLPHSQSMAGVAGDPKARQKAIVEAELQNAISAIRKPNRELAGRAITDESARRAGGGGLSQIRKTKKPQRIVPNSSPQVVKATPMRPRYRDVDASASQRHSQHSLPARESQYYSQYQSQSFTQHYDPDYHGHSLSTEVCQPISQSFPAPGYRPDDDVIGDTPATCRFKSFTTDEVTHSGIVEANEDDDVVGETPARPQHTTINATPTNSHRTRTIHTPSRALITATPVSVKSRLPTIDDNNGDDEDELALSPVFAQRASVRRSGGIKGLLFPRSGGRDSSGPMEFKSPSRATAMRTPGMGMSSRIAPVVASSPFASATARSLAMKLNPPSSSIKDATMSKHIDFKPLPRDPTLAKAAGQPDSKQTGSVFAQLGWDDEFDDI